MMIKPHLKAVQMVMTNGSDIPLQSASLDIWDKKYRLARKDGTPLDATIDDTYKRVARALADSEETGEKRAEWYEKFLWALRSGAIPAGRVISNAGAWDHKPATSTINCTVSGTIRDSMDDILSKVHEAGLTLKAGCVAPGTMVLTERGLVTADRAVHERHEQILCYDRESGSFEMRPILRHMTTHVPREENIEIMSNGVSLRTSIKHPVLVYRGGGLRYVRADEVRQDDAMVHYSLPWTADTRRAEDAWFTGAHLGDGSAEAVECYATLSPSSYGARAMTMTMGAMMPNSAPVWDYAAASFTANGAAQLTEHQVGSKTAALRVPTRITAHPEDRFLPNTAASHKPDRIRDRAGQAQQYDRYVLPRALQKALQQEAVNVGHEERLRLGFCHHYHQVRVVSRIWLDRWEARFPHLQSLIALARTLRPIDGVRRQLELPETFFDFTVDKHNNYLAGNAGLMVIHNCGIGYEFSTLRPRGAYVSGAGAYTSGPLSFMDIYDKMCFTISSAGGRRGAQMATFDVGHPDVLDFIRVKREAGRLRQFNLSLLITQEFMEAVKSDGQWKLAFPLLAKEAEADGIDLADAEHVVWRNWPVKEGYIVNEAGQVACKVYRTIRARRVWDVIMSSTYDYAEPGFILIDKVNEMNNNWFCETIRATNPCVTAGTRLHTQYGMIPIGELYASGAPLDVTVDVRALGQSQRGATVRSAVPAFMTRRDADVYRVMTEDGYEIEATEWHEFYTQRGKIKLKDLVTGDQLLVQSGKGQFGTQGSAELGVLLGLIAGDGHFTNRGKGKEAAVIGFWGNDRELAPRIASCVNTMITGMSSRCRQYRVSPVAVPDRHHVFIRSVLLARLLEHYGFTGKTKFRVPEVVWRGTEACVKGYLRGLFQTDGTVNVSGHHSHQSCSIRLASSHPELLKDIQTLLTNFGLYCSIRKRRDAGERQFPDGAGGSKSYHCEADFELIIDGESREQFMEEIGFLGSEKSRRYYVWVKDRVLRKTQSFTTRVREIAYIGKQPVYDTTQPDHNAVIFNGLVTGQCGEQPLPKYGSCLLGSVNLTKFVRDPFTDRARFDWDEYRKVVAVFTRMLDNVVAIHGLPLPEQREEITRKRRHGMGYLGLGSTLTMLCMKYGSPESLQFTEDATRELALVGWEAALELAREKGPAPIMEEDFTVTPEMLAKRPEMAADGWHVGDVIKGKVLHARYSRYMQRIAEAAPDLVDELARVGGRFTHHSSIAPTGTISLSLANNASNGIEPSFSHHYFRNVIREGKKSKEKVDVYSYELLAYRALISPQAMPDADSADQKLPDYFISAEDISPKEHVDVQAAAQKWIDSSISKTANVPTDYPYEDFKDIYLYAYEQGLKGCTTFRFNPEAFQGVLVKQADLENTVYRFRLEDGTEVEVKGNEEIEYDGEVHTAANLYDALKEGYYGKF